MPRSLVFALVVSLSACSVPMAEAPVGPDGVPPDAGWFDGSARTRLIHTMFAAADGVGLGGGRAVLAMGDMACGLELVDGQIDFDIAMPDLRVEDSTDDAELVLTSLGIQGPLVRLIPAEDPFASTAWFVDGVERARLLDDQSFVALTRGGDQCAVRWYDAGIWESETLIPGSCEGALDLAVDPASGAAFVAASGHVVQVDRAGTLTALGPGERVAFDDANGLLYVASGATLRALSDREPVFERTLPAAPFALVASRTEGIVGWADAGGGTALLRLSPTGEVVDEVALRLSAVDLAVARGGSHLAVLAAHSHAYYALD